jgi:hypothetical protein
MHLLLAYSSGFNFYGDSLVEISLTYVAALAGVASAVSTPCTRYKRLPKSSASEDD